MKEIEIKQKIEIQVKKHKQVENVLDEEIFPHKNHKIWEINKETLEIKEAQLSNATYKMFGDNKKEIIKVKGCAYVAALNKRNALKQYRNGNNGGIKTLGWSLDFM